MRKKICARISAVLLLCVLLAGARAPARGAQAAASVREAYALLAATSGSADAAYLDFLQNATEAPGEAVEEAWPRGGGTAVLDYRDTAAYAVDVPDAGLYYLALEYAPGAGAMSDFTVSVRINGVQDYAEMASVPLHLFWRDEGEATPRDSYGDESPPRQARIDCMRETWLHDSLRVTAEPLVFRLAAGGNEIRFENVSGDGLTLGKLRAAPPDLGLPSYAQYRAGHADKPDGYGLITINAIDYTEKNDAEAIYESVNNPALLPHDARSKLLNVLTWNNPGATITYGFTVGQPGNYAISLHYRNSKQDLEAFQTLSLDGAIPFAQCVALRFPATSGGWENLTLSDERGNAYQFYLEAGEHTLSLRSELAPLMRAWQYARLVSAHALRFALRITELAGSEIDRNRTWRMTRYIPEIPEYLDAYTALLTQARALTEPYVKGGRDGALLADLDKALKLIEGMRRYPDEIALYVGRLSGPDNSLLVNLSRFMTTLTGNTATPLAGAGFSLDRLYIHAGEPLPPERAGFLQSAGSFLDTLSGTFGAGKFRQTAGDGRTLMVWVNRALSHVDLLQKMADTDFTAKTGIRVRLSAITDPGKLTMSAAAGTEPDVALGLASHIPFDLASRGALHDLSAFPDFWAFAAAMPAGAFVPYLFNQGVYAVPETLDFACLVYRKDIFEALGFAVPDTWGDVAGLLPQLQRYGMNFLHNIAQGTGFKWFYQTAPLIYQHGGALYTPDGYRTAIDQPDAIAGLQALGNLFTAYSLPRQVTSFFDSFRYGTLPIGILDSAGYILLKNGAPELRGQWALAPYPGTPREDGSVSRWYVSNGQGGVVFADSLMKDEAWAFLKWWLSAQTQTEYTYTLRSTYGDAYLWLPSNLSALENAPIERADKDAILESVPWLRDVPRTPGQYMLERSLSDIWNNMISKGTSAQVATDEKVVLINREIRKKMEELGYFDAQGNPLKPYAVRDYDWIQGKMDEAAAP